MPFNDYDFKGFRSQQLKVFCHRVAEIKKTPDLINLVGAEPDYISYCRKITHSDGKSRRMFASFCRTNGFDSNDIQIRVCLVATVLGIYKQADYYGILGVAPDADDATIKQAYRKKAKMLHPDKSNGVQGRSDEFIELHAAYSHLRDPQLRKVYDTVPEVKGPWVEGSQTTSPLKRRPAAVRIVSWLCVLAGGVAIFAYAFDVYQNKSFKFASRQSTENQLVASGAQVEPDVSETSPFNDVQSASRENSDPSAGAEYPRELKQKEAIQEKIDSLPLEGVTVSMPEVKNASSETKARKENVEKTAEDFDGLEVINNNTVKVKKRTTKRGIKSQSKIRLVSQKTTSTAPGEGQRLSDDIDPTVYRIQKERVLSFLENYTKTYEESNLNKFKAFFTDNAMEQGQPFETLLPNYQKTFDSVKFLKYKIDLKSLSMEKGGGKIIIDGEYKTRFRLSNNRTSSSFGTIRMELLDEPDGLLVSTLDYEIGD
jgi:curved DNA-binding protein CbpA